MSEARYLIIEIMSEVVILFMTYSERQCAEFMTQLVQPDAQLISPPVSPYVPFTKPL